MRARVLLPLLTLVTMLLPAPPRARAADAGAGAAAFDHAHSAWQRLLEQAQRDGLVDYEALRDQPAALDAYLERLARVDEGDYTAWTPEQRQAFWLNAVNAFTLKAVADHYPFKRQWWRPASHKYPANSVKQDPRFDEEVFTAVGQQVSLAEARVLALKASDDPRLAFALTCACQGGPPLPTQAFTPEGLDAQLDAAARAFALDPRRVSLEEREEVATLSPAFRDPRLGAPLVFLRRYLKTEQAAALEEKGWTIRWQKPDWALDELGSREEGRGVKKILPAVGSLD